MQSNRVTELQKLFYNDPVAARLARRFAAAPDASAEAAVYAALNGLLLRREPAIGIS